MPPPALEQPSSASWQILGVSVLWSFLAIIVILLLLLLPIFCWEYRRRKLRGILSKEEVAQFELGRIPPSRTLTSTSTSGPNAAEVIHLEKDIEQFPHDKELEIPKEKFIFGKKHLLGQSRYCTVFRCKLSGEEQEIALKTSRLVSKRDAVKSVLDEIKILSFIGKHQNIVSIVGTYTEEIKQGVVYLATDVCLLGSLRRYLHDIKEQAITTAFEELSADDKVGVDFQELLRFSQEIASGVEYLTSKNLAHGDICTQNVLLDSQKTCKLTNISVSKRRNVYMNMLSQNVEPRRWQWMALESLEKLEFTTKSDIWSFAITLFEIFSLGNAPYCDITWNKDFSKQLATGLQMSKPVWATEKIYTFMRKCCRLDPDSRPEVADFLSVRMSHKNCM